MHPSFEAMCRNFWAQTFENELYIFYKSNNTIEFIKIICFIYLLNISIFAGQERYLTERLRRCLSVLYWLRC